MAQENINPTQIPVNPDAPIPSLNQSGYLLPIIGVILLILVVGAGAYYLGTTQNNKPEQPQTIITSKNTPQSSQNINQPLSPTTNIEQNTTTNWQTYTNTKLGYSFSYPPNYEVKGNEGDANLFPITSTVTGTAVIPLNGDSSSRIFSTLDIGTSVGMGAYFGSSDFSTAAIESRYILYGGPNGQSPTLSVYPITLSGVNGYKVIINGIMYGPDNKSTGPSTQTDYYIKAGNGHVLNIIVANNNANASSILSTFRFKN